MEIIFFGVQGAVPSPTSGNVSFAIQGAGWSLLTDTSGNPVRSLLKAKIDPRELDGLVLTHTHTDHLYALPSLVHTLWMMKRKKELVIFTNPATETKAKELLSLFGLLVRPGLFPLRFLTNFGPHTIRPGIQIKLFPVEHSVPTWGFMLAGEDRRILYTADTGPLPCPEKLGPADLVIHEASGLSEEEEALNASGHSSARQAAAAAHLLEAKALFLCHAPFRNGIEKKLTEEAKRECPEITVIYPKPYVRYAPENYTQAPSPRPRQKRAVVFDFDGTLIDTMDIKVKNFVESVLTTLEPPPASAPVLASVFTEMAGANRFSQLEAGYHRLGLPLPPRPKLETWSELYSSLNKKAIASIPEFSSVRAVIPRLKKSGFDVFLTSGILDEELQADISGRGLTTLFDEISGGNKASFLESIKKRGYTYICFVGDTEYDRSIARESATDFFKSDSNQGLEQLEDYLSRPRVSSHSVSS